MGAQTVINSKPKMAVHDEKRKFLKNFYLNCLIFTSAYITVVAVDSKTQGLLSKCWVLLNVFK